MSILKQSVLQIVNSITKEVYESPSGDLYLITEEDLSEYKYLSFIENSNLHITCKVFIEIAVKPFKRIYKLAKEDFETLTRIWET